MQKRTNANGFSKKSGEMRRVILAVVALLSALVLFSAGWLGSYFSVSERDRSLLFMLRAVQENYREEVDPDVLYDRLYDAMELDKFCTHYTPEEYADRMSERDGNNEGYGLSLITEGGRVVIYRVVGNSPAALAGLCRGMYVTSYGENSPATDSTAVADYMRGTEEAVLVCGMEGEAGTRYTLKRAAYAASHCSYADSDAAFSFRGKPLALTQTGEGKAELPASAAYIRLDAFDGRAAWEFGVCLSKMRERGRKNLVLDLRLNGGGYLSTLGGIASYLLRNAEGSRPPLLSVHYRNGDTQTYVAAGNFFGDFFDPDAHVYVLADENTASASEALIGALIDYGTCSYGDIYLRKGEDGTAHTYGKGVMQSPMIASDGNVLQLTVADIFWPKGRSIHGTGVREEDGAHAVEAPLIWGETDPMLAALCAAIAP